MTVLELIAELEKIKDKTALIAIEEYVDAPLGSGYDNVVVTNILYEFVVSDGTARSCVRLSAY